MRIAVLGPLLVVDDDERPVRVAGRRLQGLLLRLALEPGRRVSGTELVETLWPDDVPADPANSLQSLVSRLRRALGRPELIEQDGIGYRLRIAPDSVDSVHFATLTAGGRRRLAEGDREGALADLVAADALWRGDPLAEAGDGMFAASCRSQLLELRLGAALDRLRLLIELGRADETLAELEGLADAQPLNEPVAAALITALAASGRAPEALARYEATRRFLSAELGTDPGPELQALHLRLLRGELGPPVEAVASPAARRSNLRAALTSFVGREEDLERVLAAVAAHRLTTVIGPGGAGKTRLAIEAARRWLATHDESAWLVELAPVTDPDNLAATVLGALGLRDTRLTERAERPSQDARDRLLDRLQEAHCLLVMDNCEHLIDPAAQLVDDILAGAPDVRVLATSRELLGLTGESLCALAPLLLPPSGVALAEASSYPAIRLWLDRAAAVRPGFVLDQSTLGPVTEIVRRLDGLPLAIELAAARLRVLPVSEIARRLSDRFRLLTGGNRTSLPRHRTLRAVVEWSWDLLASDERLLAERLAVFPAGTEAQSATAVCADVRLPAEEVERLLTSLVDKSLLQADLPETTGAPTVRYRMLETIREYGVERLAERGELAAARLAHAEHYAALAVEWEPVLRSRDQLSALTSLQLDRDNVLAAMRYLGDSGRGEQALTVLLALAWYWSLLDSSDEMSSWASFVVEVNAGRDLPDLVYARAALVLADLNTPSADKPHWKEMRDQLGRVSDELAAAGDPPFPSLGILRPMVAAFAGRMDIADSLFAAARQSEDRWLRAAVYAAAANLYENTGEIDRMRAAIDIAYPEFVALGDRWGLSTCLIARAQLATLDNRLDDALAAYLEARRCVRELGASDDELYLHLRLADLYARCGDIPAARAELDELKAVGPLGPSPERQLFAAAAQAVLELYIGKPERAAALADELRREIGERGESSIMFDHLKGIALATTAAIGCLVGGDLDQVEADLRTAYPAAVQTMDGPIIAAVGIAVAAWLAARARFEDAAVALGASAAVRGAEDRSDKTTALVADRIRHVLGRAYQTSYDAGRTLDRVEAQQRLDPVRYLP